MNIVKSNSHWQPLTEVLPQFIKNHPELGLSGSKVAVRNFSARYGDVLIKAGIGRKAHLRAPLIVDTTRFDAAAFELVSTGYAMAMEGKYLDMADVKEEVAQQLRALA